MSAANASFQLDTFYEDDTLHLGFYEAVPCIYLKQSGHYSSHYIQSVYLPKVTQYIEQVAEAQIERKMKGILVNFSEVSHAEGSFAETFVLQIVPELRRVGIKYNVTITGSNEFANQLTAQVKKLSIRANIITMSLSSEFAALLWIKGLNK